MLKGLFEIVAVLAAIFVLLTAVIVTRVLIKATPIAIVVCAYDALRIVFILVLAPHLYCLIRTVLSGCIARIPWTH